MISPEMVLWQCLQYQKCVLSYRAALKGNPHLPCSYCAHARILPGRPASRFIVYIAGSLVPFSPHRLHNTFQQHGRQPAGWNLWLRSRLISLYLPANACGVFSNWVLPAGSCGQPRGMARTCIVLRAYGASLANPGGASHLVLFNKQWLQGVASSSHAGDLPSNSVFVAIYDSTNLKSSMFPYVLSTHPSLEVTLFPYLPISPIPVWSFSPSVFFLSTFCHRVLLSPLPCDTSSHQWSLSSFSSSIGAPKLKMQTLNSQS